MSVKFTVEPILDRQRPPSWGDVDPATKNLTGNYSGKTEGAVKPEDSIVTEENGYTNIVVLPPGQSPFDYILKRRAEIEAEELAKLEALIGQDQSNTSTQEKSDGEIPVDL